MFTNLDMISKLISDAKQNSQKQSEILSELSKGNIEKARELAYISEDLNKALHTIVQKLADSGPTLTKAAFTILAANSFVEDFATKVGKLNTNTITELNKALSEFLEVPAEYKSGSVITKAHAPLEKSNQVDQLLEGNKVIVLENEDKHAKEITDSIESSYFDSIKSWYEQSTLVQDVQTSQSFAPDC